MTLQAKFASLFCAMLICFIFNVSIDTLQPTLDAGIAVDQFEDSELAAQTIRGLTRFEAQIPLVTCGLTALFGLLLFRKNIVAGINYAYADNED